MNVMAMNMEPRITTSNIYNTKARSEKMARLRGLNKLYYNMNVDSKCDKEHEVNMMCKLRAEHWSVTIEMFHEKRLAQKAAQMITDKSRTDFKGGFDTE